YEDCRLYAVAPFSERLPLVMGCWDPEASSAAAYAIFVFLNAWNEFLAALIIMTQEANFTLPIMLTSVRSGYYGAIDWGALQAGITVTILPCIILFLFLQRYYMQGLMGGAVKG
ncbi:MAG: hypothetical protein ACK47M_14585, partial [Caldilinea sp.]